MTTDLSLYLQIEAATVHITLQSHLTSLSGLHATYINYRAAYGHLVQEMDRRRKYREAVDIIIRGMNEQLQALRQGKPDDVHLWWATHSCIEEISHREQFFKAEAAYLPEDLCPYVGDLPTMLEVTALTDEVPVAVDSEYISEVRRSIYFALL